MDRIGANFYNDLALLMNIVDKHKEFKFIIDSTEYTKLIQKHNTEQQKKQTKNNIMDRWWDQLNNNIR